MENYYSSARVLTVTLIVLAITCLYVSLTYFNQSLVLRKSRADFAWWFVFSQLEKDPQIYRDYEAKTAARKPIFLYAYFEPVGHCFAKEVADKLQVEISRQDFDLSKIESSFYAPITDMPTWQIALDLRAYEPTKVTDLTLALLEVASKEQGGTLTQDKLLPARLGQEELKRVKQLRGSAQFFGIDIKDGDEAPSLYRKIQKEFEKQKVKIPAIDLDFFALSGVWIIAVISAVVATLLNNQVTFIEAEKIADLHDPWIIFDARSVVARAMAYAWLLALVVSPVIITGTLLYMTFAAAWINGFVGSWYAYAASAAAIIALAILGCRESWSAAYGLNKSRRAYWIFRERAELPPMSD